MHYPAAEKYACLGEKRMDESHFSYRSNSPKTFHFHHLDSVKLGKVRFVTKKSIENLLVYMKLAIIWERKVAI